MREILQRFEKDGDDVFACSLEENCLSILLKIGQIKWGVCINLLLEIAVGLRSGERPARVYLYLLTRQEETCIKICVHWFFLLCLFLHRIRYTLFISFLIFHLVSFPNLRISIRA